MSKERNSFVEFVDKSNALKLEALEKANGYLEESGVMEAVQELNLNNASSEDLQKGTVTYTIFKDKDHYFDIRVDSQGTIKIKAAVIIGSSTIKREDWTENPELIPQGLIKAYKHPYKNEF